MGLFDLFSGGNSTSSNPVTNTTNTTDLSRVDSRVIESGANVGGDVQVTGNSGALTITTTDQGAVKAGTDIALESMRGLASNVNATESIARDSISQAYGLANQARQSETSGAINNLLQYAFWIGAIGIAAWAFTRRK